MNTQLYENSPLLGSSIEEAVNEDPQGFYNRKDPNLAILHEKPEHRLVILLKLEGRSNREIAKLIGYTEPWVSQILRQPWAKDHILAELKKAGSEVVTDLLASAAADSVFKVIQLRDTADDESVQLRAAQDLLDRHLGKATQKVESNQRVTHISGDAEKLDSELATIEAELTRITGTERNETTTLAT